MTRDRFYITTPIYYVNDVPHIGTAYTTILADVLARYHRLQEIPTFFLTGTDEHGQKVQRASEKAGITPMQHVDQTVVRFQALWKKLHITHDDFIRTTEPRHVKMVQQCLQTLFDKGEIYRAEYDGWYCVSCERFFTDKDVTASACAECGRALDHITESNYFFRMSQYQSWLTQYIHEHPRFILPEYRRNETLGFLKKPLTDLCISRPKTRLSWGIELPFDPNFVTYVWFDALINYISAVGCLADEATFSRWWPASCHLIGKDILTTHTVYWPTMLKAMGLPLPETVFAHGWWLVGDSKMGKSTGNAINPMAMIDTYGVDALRYFLMAEMSLGQDCSFSEEALIRRYNADLANDLGNLLSRVLKMVNSHCAGKIPAADRACVDAPERELQAAALGAAQAMTDQLEAMRLDLGIAAVSAAVRSANRYLEQRQPWTLAKHDNPAALHTVLYYAAETLRIAGGLLFPVMPDKIRELYLILGLPDAPPVFADLRQWGRLAPGTAVGVATPLFPRIQAPAPTAVNAAPQATPPPPSPTPASAPKPEGLALIDYTDFTRIQLRTAKILTAERIEKADKLLRIQLDVGGENRQVVAGIALYYKPEELPGKTVVLVANLKPAKIRGVESNGMLLAASIGSTLKLVTVDGDLPSGAVVK